MTTKLFKSIAVWPDTIRVGNIVGKNESSDIHATREQAEAVCRGLCREGFGGRGVVFPIETRVEEVMCQSCFELEFKTEDPVKLEREKYRLWLQKNAEKAEAEAKEAIERAFDD